MKWVFNPTKITKDGYCEFRRGEDQGGNIISNQFIYSPLIDFPSYSAICTDEHNHYTRNADIKTEIKFTLYNSMYTDESLGSVTFTSNSDIVFRHTTSNNNDQSLSGLTGYPVSSGSYYLQIKGDELLQAFIDQGVLESYEPLGSFHNYPLYMEFVCEINGCKIEPKIERTAKALEDLTYNAGYYYVPFSKPNNGVSYSSVWARVALAPYCPHSIVEMRGYRDVLVATASTDQNASTITMNNAIISLSTYSTLYLKISYSHVQTLIDELIGACPGSVEQKADENGWALEIQFFWYKANEEHEFIGDRGEHSHFKASTPSKTYHHDIAIYHGANPVHKYYKEVLQARLEDNSNTLHILWDPDNLIETCSTAPEVYIGLAIQNSLYYNRVLKYKDVTNPRERRSRSRIRPKEKVIWLQMADIFDEEAYIEDLKDTIINSIEGTTQFNKLQYFINNFSDPYVYIRPVLGRYRPDSGDGQGGPAWMIASDKMFLIKL